MKIKIKSLVSNLDNKFLGIDMSNIPTSLLMITNFIQSRNIKGKYEKDIPIITSFDQVA